MTILVLNERVMGSAHWIWDRLRRRGIVLVALIAYFWILGDFLVGRAFFAVDYYDAHLPFELAFRSLSQDHTMPTWLPLVQNGRAMFMDMANTYTPFGVDFLLTYVLTKPFGLDASVGLMAIHTWVIVLLNVGFAMGCRLFAREILISRHSADLSFLLALFSGAFLLARTPSIILCNLFAPWFLLYLTRLTTQGPDRFLVNVCGMTMAVVLGVFHQFTSQSTAVIPLLAFYAIGLGIFGYGRVWTKGFVRQGKTWRGAMTLVVLVLTIVGALAPLSWEYAYFITQNSKVLYGDETPQSVLASAQGGARYTLEDYRFERFEWQKLLSYALAVPSTLERVTTISNAYVSLTVHDFHYFGALGAILMVVGVLAGRNLFKFPLVLTIVLYGLLVSAFQSPFLETLKSAGYPMTRHLLWSGVHVVPFLAVLAGMGLDAVLRLSRARPMPIRLWLTSLRWRKAEAAVAGLCALALCGALVTGMLVKHTGASMSAQGGLLCSLPLVLAAVAVVGFSFISPRPSVSLAPLFGLLLWDLTVMQYPAQRVAIAGEHAAQPALPNDHPGYESALAELDVLDNYPPFALIPPEAYASRDKPGVYHRLLYRYWVLGNRSYYDVMAHAHPTVWDAISGFTQPRLTLVDHAVSDPSGELAREAFKTAQGVEMLRQRVFIRGDRRAGPSDSGDVRERLLERVTSWPVVESVRHFHELDPSMVSTNVASLVSGLLGKDVPPTLIRTGPGPALRRDGREDSGRALWWIMIDFGPDHEEIINLLTSPYPLPFERGRLFLDASHDGRTWLSTTGEPLAFDQLGWRGMPLDKREWHVWNDEPYRFYRLIIDPGVPALDPEAISAFHLGYTGRAVADVRYHSMHVHFPLAEFVREPRQDQDKFVVLSHSLPIDVVKEISSHPAFRFWYQFDLAVRDQAGAIVRLAPTWRNQWFQPGLFQVNYRMDGRLSVTMPTEAMTRLADWAVEGAIRMPDTGIKVQSFGANHLKAAVHRERDGWLYYAETWDPYWEASLDGKPIKVFRANLQYKAVAVPAGDHVVEFQHRPRSFLRLIQLSYLLQGATIGLWILTARRV